MSYEPSLAVPNETKQIDTDELANLCKALAHPVRLKIIRHLLDEDRCICGRIVEVLPLAQSTVSQHLKVLREAGLVAGEPDGPRSCYCLDLAGLRRARAGFDQLLSGLDCATGCGC